MLLVDVAAAVGKGLFAGLAGVAAMTASQEIEMKFSGREPSTGPGDMVADLLGVEPKGQEERESFSNLAHWTWGTAWGVPRGLIALAGLRGGKAVAAHAAFVLGRTARTPFREDRLEGHRDASHEVQAAIKAPGGARTR